MQVRSTLRGLDGIHCRSKQHRWHTTRCSRQGVVGVSHDHSVSTALVRDRCTTFGVENLTDMPPRETLIYPFASRDPALRTLSVGSTTYIIGITHGTSNQVGQIGPHQRRFT
jgi:hypothetical protein